MKLLIGAGGAYLAYLIVVTLVAMGFGLDSTEANWCKDHATQLATLAVIVGGIVGFAWQAHADKHQAA